MNLTTRIRTMDRRLRTMLIATGLLLIPQIGQLMAIRDINTSGHDSPLALLFEFAAIICIPTSLILTGAIVVVVRKQWREHERLLILAAINALIAVNLILFLFATCSWSHIFGLALRTCH